MRVCRTSSVFFSFRKKRRKKILCVSIELVLYDTPFIVLTETKFFYWREKILCVIWREIQLY